MKSVLQDINSIFTHTIHPKRGDHLRYFWNSTMCGNIVSFKLLLFKGELCGKRIAASEDQRWSENDIACLHGNTLSFILDMVTNNMLTGNTQYVQHGNTHIGTHFKSIHILNPYMVTICSMYIVLEGFAWWHTCFQAWHGKTIEKKSIWMQNMQNAKLMNNSLYKQRNLSDHVFRHCMSQAQRLGSKGQCILRKGRRSAAFSFFLLHLISTNLIWFDLLISSPSSLPPNIWHKIRRASSV